MRFNNEVVNALVSDPWYNPLLRVLLGQYTVTVEHALYEPLTNVTFAVVVDANDTVVASCPGAANWRAKFRIAPTSALALIAGQALIATCLITGVSYRIERKGDR
jgi:hypothetical protein